MERNSIKASDRDGYEIELLPDVIDITGLGWDIFRKDHVSFNSVIELFREVKEVQPYVIESDYSSGGIAKVCEIRRFDVKLSLDWFEGTNEDKEEVFRGFFFKDQEGDWVFRMKGVKKFYEGTPGERWTDDSADAMMDG